MKDNGGKDTWWGDDEAETTVHDGSKFSKCTPGPGHFEDPFEVVVAVIDSNDVMRSVRQKYLQAMVDELRAGESKQGGKGEHCEKARHVLTMMKDQSIRTIALPGLSTRAQVEELCRSIPTKDGELKGGPSNNSRRGGARASSVL